MDDAGVVKGLIGIGGCAALGAAGLVWAENKIRQNAQEDARNKALYTQSAQNAERYKYLPTPTPEPVWRFGLPRFNSAGDIDVSCGFGEARRLSSYDVNFPPGVMFTGEQKYGSLKYAVAEIDGTGFWGMDAARVACQKVIPLIEKVAQGVGVDLDWIETVIQRAWPSVAVTLWGAGLDVPNPDDMGYGLLPWDVVKSRDSIAVYQAVTGLSGSSVQTYPSISISSIVQNLDGSWDIQVAVNTSRATARLRPYLGEASANQLQLGSGLTYAAVSSTVINELTRTLVLGVASTNPPGAQAASIGHFISNWLYANGVAVLVDFRNWESVANLMGSIAELETVNSLLSGQWRNISEKPQLEKLLTRVAKMEEVVCNRRAFLSGAAQEGAEFLSGTPAGRAARAVVSMAKTPGVPDSVFSQTMSNTKFLLFMARLLSGRV